MDKGALLTKQNAIEQATTPSALQTAMKIDDFSILG
jgi:hypothetical protein